MDTTERPLKVDTVVWLPDGQVQISGSIGIVAHRFTLDPESWKKITDLVTWARREGVEPKEAA
jgi:hypothetical protein